MPRARYIAFNRACTRTTSRTSIECTRPSSRNRLYSRGALNTGILIGVIIAIIVILAIVVIVVLLLVMKSKKKERMS